MRRFHSPESALAMDGGLTEVQARVLARDIARVAREYGRSVTKVRNLKIQLRSAEAQTRELRRKMRLLIQVSTPFNPKAGDGIDRDAC